MHIYHYHAEVPVGPAGVTHLVGVLGRVDPVDGLDRYKAVEAEIAKEGGVYLPHLIVTSLTYLGEHATKPEASAIAHAGELEAKLERITRILDVPVPHCEQIARIRGVMHNYDAKQVKP